MSGFNLQETNEQLLNYRPAITYVGGYLNDKSAVQKSGERESKWLYEEKD